jgi:dihydropteroate synthase
VAGESDTTLRAGAAPRVWQCGLFDFALNRPLVMGILNVTPDSFSDGGLHADAGAAVARASEMLEAGADIIDVGGESTRPGSAEVHLDEELRRAIPVIEQLASESIPVSIDTRHAEVARAAYAAGACIINDISGFGAPEMVAAAAASDLGLVVMHMKGEPATMQVEPHYDDVVAEVSAYLFERAQYLESAGVARERIAIDPGIGFGKTTGHNLEILRRLPEIVALGYPVVVGASRKRFVGEITGQNVAAERLEGSLAAAVWAVAHGAHVARVHDVPQTVRALKVADAIARGGATPG